MLVVDIIVMNHRPDDESYTIEGSPAYVRLSPGAQPLPVGKKLCSTRVVLL
jgi:hypothetical protein